MTSFRTVNVRGRLLLEAAAIAFLLAGYTSECWSQSTPNFVSGPSLAADHTDSTGQPSNAPALQRTDASCPACPANGSAPATETPAKNGDKDKEGKKNADDKNCKENGDKKKNGKDKEKNGDDKDKEKQEEMKKILQQVAEGKMTVEQAQAKLAEKSDEKKDDDKDKDDKDKEDKDKDDKDKEDKDKWKLLPDGWNFHAQTTLIPNFQPGFGAKYSGPNSLGTAPDREGTITSDLFFGVPLWQGAELHADILMWQGFGLSNSFGLENFPNADAYKAGSDTPRFMLSHLFVRQTIGLGGEQEDVPDGQFTLPGKRDVSRLTFTVGRLNMAELFDYNTYDHDPHTQFMSWSSTMLTWDYPADTIGFTTGLAVELNQPEWAVRYGWFQLPSLPNGLTSDDRIFLWPVEPGEITSTGEFWKQFGMILELERRWKIEDHPGAVRLQAWADHGDLASYAVATPLLLASPPPPTTPQGVQVTVPAAAFAFRFKYGFGLNWEQEIADNVGLFGRYGWQDGHVAAAAFNDADWTFQLGLSFKGAAWHRPGDTFGLCGNLVGASSEQQAFLKAGGTGILNGDGNLTYSPEKSLETYYDIGISKNLHLAFDYQFFADPAFNADRGPVNVFGARLHWEY
jgi:high affinity Mn2+ porin